MNVASQHWNFVRYSFLIRLLILSVRFLQKVRTSEFLIRQDCNFCVLTFYSVRIFTYFCDFVILLICFAPILLFVLRVSGENTFALFCCAFSLNFLELIFVFRVGETSFHTALSFSKTEVDTIVVKTLVIDTFSSFVLKKHNLSGAFCLFIFSTLFIFTFKFVLFLFHILNFSFNLFLN